MVDFDCMDGLAPDNHPAYAGRSPLRELPVIDPRRCTSCGDCLRVCPTQCLVLIQQIPVVTEDQACIRCQVCSLVCGVEAVQWMVTTL